MKAYRSLNRWLLGLGGGRLAVRIVALSLLLLLLVQAASFGVLRSHIDSSARAQLADELRLSERVWRRLLDNNAQRLRQGAMLLSADYGFRSAVASGDTATIDSALDNQGGRIGATVAALLDTQFQARVVHAGEADPALLAPMLHDVALPLSRGGAGSRLALVGGQPHQWVLVPLRAPLTIGWVLMGFPLGQALVEDMHALSGVHVTLLAAEPSSPRRVAASTLGELAQVLAARPQLAAGSLVLDGEESYAHPVTMEAGTGFIQAVLTRPVAEVAAPFRQVQVLLGAITLMGLALFAVGSAWTARRVTGPLRSLVLASERLALGEYNVPMRGVRRADEIGELARAFDHMRASVAASQIEMERLAYADRLTGMPNRERFRQALQQAIERSSTPQGQISVLMLDLDRFKHVNDVLGYAVGDRLLCAVAERLTTVVLRDGDLVACLGGDKFALLLPGTDVDAAGAVAQRIARSFERPVKLDDHTVDLSAGVGIACWPAHGGDAQTLIVHAEVAMYAAKGKPEVAQVYDPAKDSASLQSLSLLSELRQAVEQDELRLFVQPKIRLGDGRVVGGEALLRWQHPLRGLLPPLQFIPFAEQTGFVRHLTLWVLEESARQWAALQVHGPLRLSVNLSTRDLLDLELPQKLDAILARHGVPESGLCLEITESAIMDDPVRAQSTLNALSARGFKLSIDDFGTGYSSLAYLRRLPVDELKIDRSFVIAMERNADDANIVRSTIELAHNLGLSVVAEGIENAHVLGQLAKLDCDEGQGYHMSRPLPVAEFVAWVGRWNQQHAATDAVRVTREAAALLQ